MFAVPGYTARQSAPPESPRTYEQIRAFVRRHAQKDAREPPEKRKGKSKNGR